MMRGGERGSGSSGRGRGRGRGRGAKTAPLPASEQVGGTAVEYCYEDVAGAGIVASDAPKKTRRNRRTFKKNDGTVPAIENYGEARVQALMVGDRHRTGAYHRAIMENPQAFKGKTVLDVGAGQGILSMFAAKAGAAKVYAVERSSMAKVARALVEANGLSDIVEVCNEDLDRLELPDKVDVVISEWMGVGLIHERMLEVVLRARDRFLKPEGHIFPTTATLYLAPLCDDGAESELYAAHTWAQKEHFGIDWSAAQRMLPYHGPEGAFVEGIGWPLQRIIVPSSRIKSKAAEHLIDLRTVSVDDSKKFTFDFAFDNVDYPVCGYALWFDVDFLGPDADVKLPTGPSDPPTHWRQLAWYYNEPMLTPSCSDEGVRVLKGNFGARANPRTAGYFMSITDSLGQNMDTDSADFLWTECR